MATVSTSILASPGDQNTTVTIFNVALGPVNTEQSQALPANTKSFLLKSRGNSEVKLAYSLGGSGTTYVTVPRASVYKDENFYTSQTIYFQSPQTGDTIEIIAYV